MLFYGSQSDALALLKSQTAAASEPIVSDDDLNLILVRAKRADYYSRWPTDTNWQPTFEIDWAGAEVMKAKMAAGADDTQYLQDSRGTAATYRFLNFQRLLEGFEGRISTSAPMVKRGQPYQRLLV